MYSVSEEYAKKIISNDRAFSLRLTFGSSTVLTGTTIQDIALDEIVNSGDSLTMGCACSNKITVNLINPPTDIDYDGATFTAEVGLLLTDRPVTYEWIPLGKFYATDPETSNDFKNLKLTAYDGFVKMTDKYIPTVPEDTTLQAVYDDLRGQLKANCGIELKERTLPDYRIPIFPLLDITYTQAIAYVAGCLGEFARFDREGNLETVWFTDYGQQISRSMQYMNGFKRILNQSNIRVTSLSTGTEENLIVKGDGSTGLQINFENPYITNNMADDIYSRVYNFEYVPCSVQWRGNPAVQAGDIVYVYDKDNFPHIVPIMSQSIKMGGGLNAKIECKGSGETKNTFSSNFEPLGQKIERLNAKLEQAILGATEAITGNKGGVVVLHDTNSDGKPDELLIMDVDDIKLATKVWRWNKAGLGYANNANGNAYLGPYSLAITADGQINANFITTGSLSAERISVDTYDGMGRLTDYIRFGDGYLEFGETDNAIKLKLENNQIAFYRNDTRIAWFTNNSFEIENLTEGKIRFQNFGFIPRASGNLTFTKLV
jgi:hypothetical protein